MGIRQTVSGLTLAGIMVSGATTVAIAQPAADSFNEQCAQGWFDPLSFPPSRALAERPLMSSLPEVPQVFPGSYQLDQEPDQWTNEPTLLPWARAPITAVAGSPNGQYILSGSADGTLHLWTGAGEPIGFPIGHPNGIQIEWVGFSADGQTLVSGDRLGRLRYWTLTGQFLRELKTQNHDYATPAWSVSADGDIVIGSLSGDLQIRTFSGELVSRTTLAHSVYSLTFSPDGQFLAVGLGSGSVQLLDRQLQPMGNPIELAIGAPVALSISPSSQTIAFSDSAGWTYLSALTGEQLAAFPSHRPQHRPGLRFSPGGEALINGDESLRRWDLLGNRQNAGIRRQSLRGPGWVSTFAAVGQRWATGGDDCTLKLWSTAAEPIVLPFHAAETLATSPEYIDADGRLWSLRVRPGDQRTILPTETQLQLQQWDPRGQLLQQSAWIDDLPLFMTDWGFHSVSQQFFAIDVYANIHAWDTSGRLVNILNVGNDSDEMALHPQAEVIALASHEALHLLDFEGNALRPPIPLPHNSILSLEFSPDGQFLAAGVSGESAALWWLHGTGEQLGDPLFPPIPFQNKAFHAIAFSQDSQYLAAGEHSGAIAIWNRQGKQISQFSLPYNARLWQLAFSPDNKLLVSLDSEANLHLWQQDGTLVGALLLGNEVDIHGVRFSADGQALIIGHERGLSRWWLPLALSNNAGVSQSWPTPMAETPILQSPFASPPADIPNSQLNDEAAPFPEVVLPD